MALVAVASPAVAQNPRAPALDALTDLLGLPQTARGWVVRHREGMLILRGDDDRIQRINTAGLDAGSLAMLKEGRYVTVAVKPSLTGAMPIAAAVEPGEIEPSAAPR
jgi:hypothetical protein